MFGFSFPKILLLVAVICIVWFGFKFLARVQGAGDGKPVRPLDGLAEKIKRAAGKTQAKRPPVEDMTKCPRCGAYYPSGTDHACDAGA